MKKLSILLMLIIAFGVLTAINFDPELFYSKTIIACFTKTAIPNLDGVVNFDVQDGIISTGMSSFDQLAKELHIVELKEMHPYVKVPELNDNVF